jgi:hypothetical protein
MGAEVSTAIQPRLGTESELIGRNFRGLGQEQAGMGARSNLPVSIKAALQAALGMGQDRAQRDARRSAMTEGEQLRRSDLEQTYKLLDSMLGFTSAGRGQSMQGLGAAAGAESSSDSSTLATLASLAGMAAMFMSNSRFKEDIAPVAEDEILDAIASLPVYGWRYKGDPARHVGPLAEDFRETFGLGDGDDTIHVVDAVGTLMAATQALARKVERLEAHA